MKSHNVDTLVMGHHADDQVETMLMRIIRQGGRLQEFRPGYAGMKRIRRWGMGSGSPSDLGWAGIEGMNKWIVRPLLDVTKVGSFLHEIRSLLTHFD